ncbi:hypothetical protein BP5796_09294 [Coleophoma crateriformis]|uniref:Uncharacterized protein n=1 Tax=Coleophoma crateriformis TaxID=565419 RepID=A0A3D8R3N1_9HELO|nr:hypothetical protein BP5796_09294 [Coleophoma crateriformis]
MDKWVDLETRYLGQLYEAKRKGGKLQDHLELYVLTHQHDSSGSELWSIFMERYPSKEDLTQSEVEFLDASPALTRSPFVRMLSLYFQIRDDYQNLASEQVRLYYPDFTFSYMEMQYQTYALYYAKQKGFAQDLDEAARTQQEIMDILKRRKPGAMSLEMKQYIIGEMKKTNALQPILELLNKLT